MSPYRKYLLSEFLLLGLAAKVQHLTFSTTAVWFSFAFVVVHSGKAGSSHIYYELCWVGRRDIDVCFRGVMMARNFQAPYFGLQ